MTSIGRPEASKEKYSGTVITPRVQYGLQHKKKSKKKAKYSSQMDKKRLKMSNLQIMVDHFQKIRGLKTKHGILEENTYNVDEKGFCQAYQIEQK